MIVRYVSLTASERQSYIRPTQPEWTETIDMKAKREKGLGLATGLESINVVLTEVRGSQSVFAGLNRTKWPQLQYFLWNSITESCYRITKPVGKDKIIDQIKKDLTKVEVEEYGGEDGEEIGEEDDG